MKVINQLGLFLATALFLSSCATAKLPRIPTYQDSHVQDFVNIEARRILAVTPNANQVNSYRFLLADGKEWGGMSVGNHVIYIDYNTARAALEGGNGLEQLRITLAHEIGHDVAGHMANQKAIVNSANIAQLIGKGMSYVPGVIGLAGSAISFISGWGGLATKHLYLRSAELEADRLGIEYWKRLGWDCRLWVYRFEHGLEAGIGDFHHPGGVRLRQAADLCLSAIERQRIYAKSERIERERQEVEYGQMDRERDEADIEGP